MRIAFVSTILHFPWGGADTLWTHAAEAAARRGDRLLLSVSETVAAHPRVAALRSATAEVEVRRVPPWPPSLATRILRHLGLSPDEDARLLARLRRFEPDLVVFSQGGTYDLLLLPAVTAWLRETRRRFRVIANWQEEKPALAPAEADFIRAAFADADLLAFVSTRNLRVTERHLGRALPNARVVHNPLRVVPADATPWPGAAGPRLATVSRLDPVKGIDLLLRALAEADPALPPDWSLTVFGSGPAEADLRQLARELGLGERVRFAGHVSRLADLWRDHHALVSPARDEGVPMTIPEAMLCGRIAIATAVGGAEDWIIPGETGFLCPEPTAAALAATLRSALAEFDRWPGMAGAAARAAAARYRPDDFLQLLA